MIRTEKFNGYNIRYLENNGEWYAVLNDICSALEIEIDLAKETLPKEALIELPYAEIYTLCVDEFGIFELLYMSDILEAKRFFHWSKNIMSKLRQKVGLKSYEVLRMTEPDIQDQIDSILDAIYWDEEKNCIMYSLTVQGGDVEQIPFEEA